MTLPTSTHGILKSEATSMPKNRIAVTSVIKRIFKKSGFIQDSRMVRFLSENDKIENSEQESGLSDRASWTGAQNEVLKIFFSTLKK
jgi:hypothetical protein